MRATVMYGAFDVRVEDVPDPKLLEETDALVAVEHAGICGSDLWPYKAMESTRPGAAWVTSSSASSRQSGPPWRREPGDLVLSPFLWSDGSCVFCRRGLHSSCLNGGRYGLDDVDGGQGEAVRVPQADGTLVVLPVDAETTDAVSPHPHRRDVHRAPCRPAPPSAGPGKPSGSLGTERSGYAA